MMIWRRRDLTPRAQCPASAPHIPALSSPSKKLLREFAKGLCRPVMPLKIDDLLRVATSHGASDLHLKAGAFPMMRLGGELYPVADAPRLKPEDTLDMAFTLMSNRQKQRFKEESEVDIAYGISGIGRLRANIFQQRGDVSIVKRLMSDQHQSKL